MERYRVPDTQRIHWVSGPVFFLNRTFSAAWNIRYPDTSLKRGVSRPVNVLIFLDLPRIMECRWRTLQFLPFIFTKIPRYGLCYPNYNPNLHDTWRLYSVECDEIPRYVKFRVFSLPRNSMVREIPGTQTPLEFHGSWNYRCWNRSKTPWKLQQVCCTKFDDTFNFHAWYRKNWYRLFTPLIPHDMFPGQHCTPLHFRDLFEGLLYYTENEF